MVITQGADVNFLNEDPSFWCIQNNDISLFEALVNAKLLKSHNMNYLFLFNEVIRLNLSNWHNVLTLKNTLNPKFAKFENWLNNGQVQSAANLHKAWQKFSNLNATYLTDDNNAKKLALDKYVKGVVDSLIDDNLPKITEYFAKNWHKSMLICKDFSHCIFGIPELKCFIGQMLVDHVLINNNPAVVQEQTPVVEIVGDDNNSNT